tara:strand:- start:534 stop:671 length:138 start_codon:yes stop_codon:yes gene_type:complete
MGSVSGVDSEINFLLLFFPILRLVKDPKIIGKINKKINLIILPLH